MPFVATSEEATYTVCFRMDMKSLHTWIWEAIREECTKDIVPAKPLQIEPSDQPTSFLTTLMGVLRVSSDGMLQLCVYPTGRTSATSTGKRSHADGDADGDAAADAHVQLDEYMATRRLAAQSYLCQVIDTNNAVLLHQQSNPDHDPERAMLNRTSRNEPFVAVQLSKDYFFAQRGYMDFQAVITLYNMLPAYVQKFHGASAWVPLHYSKVDSHEPNPVSIEFSDGPLVINDPTELYAASDYFNRAANTEVGAANVSMVHHNKATMKTLLSILHGGEFDPNDHWEFDDLLSLLSLLNVLLSANVDEDGNIADQNNALFKLSIYIVQAICTIHLPGLGRVDVASLTRVCVHSDKQLDIVLAAVARLRHNCRLLQEQ